MHHPLCVCVHMWVCDEHLTAKDLKNRESILLMRVLELGEEGYKTSHPVLSICLSLLLSHLLNSLSLLLHLLSLSLLLSPSVCFFAQWRAPFCCFLSSLPQSLVPPPAFLRPTSIGDAKLCHHLLLSNALSSTPPP